MESFRKVSMVIMLVLLVAAGHAISRAAAINICNVSSGDLLSKCKPAISGFSPSGEPSKGCCKVLAKGNLRCLCSFKDSWWLVILGINVKAAMGLPHKCNLTQQTEC